MKYVYLLREGEGHYKIGVATNVKKRLSGIQTSHHGKVEVVTSKLVRNPYEVEGFIHESLKPLRGIGGTEWFTLDPEAALDIAVMINNNPDIDRKEDIEIADILHRLLKEKKQFNEKLNFIINAYQKDYKKHFEPKQQLDDSDEPKSIESFSTKISKEDEDKELFWKAEIVVSQAGKASTSLLQRKLRIGYGRAARLIEQLEEQGIIGPMDGSRPRIVLKQASEVTDIAKHMVNDMIPND
jgi:hypothetical protein